MSNLRRRVSFGDASSSTRQFHMDSAQDKPEELDKRNGSKRNKLVSGARKVGDYMFKSGLTIPAHASFGTPSFLPDTSAHLSTTIVTNKSHLSNLNSANYSTLSFSMPRMNDFQGVPTPMFAADAYYFAPNTNPTAKRTKKPKPRSSVSSETASTSKGTSNGGTRSNDDIIGSLYSQTPTSLARANSTAADATTHRSGASPKKRPSTANPSTNVQLPVASTSLGDPVPAIPLPAISAENTKPANLAPESTKMLSKPNGYKLKNGRRHHPYPSSKAPYPRSYESTAIDQSVFQFHLLHTLYTHSLPLVILPIIYSSNNSQRALHGTNLLLLQPMCSISAVAMAFGSWTPLNHGPILISSASFANHSSRSF